MDARTEVAKHAELPIVQQGAEHTAAADSLFAVKDNLMGLL